MLLNPARITAQNTYSGSYSIINLLTPEYESGSKINGIAKYNYIEKNERRIYHGPFKFSTTQNQNGGDFIPSLIWLPTDSITISGLFNQGKKNGLWTIEGYGDSRASRISIEMTYDNGVLDGTVKGSSYQNSTEICSFNYSFSKGKLNGPFRINNEKIDYPGYGYPKINCLLNFTDGLFDGNNTISFFNDDNKEFKLLRQYDHGLLYLDKYLDLSTGEYIINKKYNIDFSLADFNYTNYNNNFADFEDKYLRASEQLQNGYKDYFTLLTEISKGTAHEIPFVGYFLTKNSEIFSIIDERDTIDRVVNNRNHDGHKSYLSDKDEFIRRTSPKDLWSNIYLDKYSYSVEQTAFVEIPMKFKNGEHNNLTRVNDLIFDLLNLILIFPLGQDKIEIKPIKEPYIFVSQEAEELYASYRTKFLSLDSINRFKQDSIRFRFKIYDDLGSFNSDQEILSSQFSFYYFRWGDEDFQKVNNALLRQFQNIKRTEQELSGQSNLKFVSEDLRVKQDSILNHYKEFQIRLELLNKILLATVDLEKERFDQFFLIPKFQSQLKKFFEIPGANDRYNDNRQFIFRPDKSSETELNHILQIINERKEIYSKIVKDNIRVTPRKYTNIDEFLKDLKTM